ncbi:hypothetical protein [Halorussus salinus]|uniref:hypothetical protein n=1 Tax=Halorussus salinus TaxID=1364935 RepID=UPI0010927DC7|nr:hypothetical protein [Halorussus salinus]
MTDQCPYLEYRSLSDGDDEEAPSETTEEAADPHSDRPYCTAADEFVQPMRADICNDRYDLDHEEDCEIYRDRERASDGNGSDGE